MFLLKCDNVCEPESSNNYNNIVNEIPQLGCGESRAYANLTVALGGRKVKSDRFLIQGKTYQSKYYKNKNNNYNKIVR